MNEILRKRIEEAANDYVHRKIIGMSEDFENGAKYALSHQWISIEEALPESEDWVIVMYDVGFMKVQKGIFVRLNRPFCENIKITHWMSIPKFETKEKE